MRYRLILLLFLFASSSAFAQTDAKLTSQLQDAIKGFNGQLLVTGDVGKKAKLTMNEPEYTQHHSEQRTGFMPISTGKVTTVIPYTYTDQWNTDTGAKPPFNKVASLGVPVKTGP